MSDLAAVRNAVRSHRPLPTETVLLDLGELGCNVPAVITFEINPADGDARGRWPASIDLHHVTVDGLDLMPFIVKQHPDCLAGIVDKVEAKLREAA